MERAVRLATISADNPPTAHRDNQCTRRRIRTRIAGRLGDDRRLSLDGRRFHPPIDCTGCSHEVVVPKRRFQPEKLLEGLDGLTKRRINGSVGGSSQSFPWLAAISSHPLREMRLASTALPGFSQRKTRLGQNRGSDSIKCQRADNLPVPRPMGTVKPEGGLP